MSRCLLAQTKLEALKTWLTCQGIPHRPGIGEYQVLQVMTKKAGWQAVYRQEGKTEHFTVTHPLEGTIRKFISEQRENPRKKSYARFLNYMQGDHHENL